LEGRGRSVDVLLVRIAVRVTTFSAGGVRAAPVVVSVLRTECVIIDTNWHSAGSNSFIHFDNILVLICVIDPGSGIKEGSNVPGGVGTPRWVVHLAIAGTVVHTPVGVHAHEPNHIRFVEDSSSCTVFEGLEECHVGCEVSGVAQIVESQVDLSIQTSGSVVDGAHDVRTLALHTSLLQVDRDGS